MQSADYRGADDLRVETVPVPRIHSVELLVKVGVCGLRFAEPKRIQYGTVEPPVFSGTRHRASLFALDHTLENGRFAIASRSSSCVCAAPQLSLAIERITGRRGHDAAKLPSSRK